MGKMSAERIFRKPKRKPAKNALEAAIDKMFDSWSDRQWAGVYARTGNVSPDQWAASAYGPHFDAINKLFGARLVRVFYDGVEMKSSKRFWSWDHIRAAVVLELERGDTSHDWQSLIDLIDSYHCKAEESPSRDLK